MAYHTTLYLVLFLPASMIAYQLMPVKYRFYVLLLFGYYFYYCISGTLIIYIMAATITTYLSGLLIEKKKETKPASRYFFLPVFFCNIYL